MSLKSYCSCPHLVSTVWIHFSTFNKLFLLPLISVMNPSKRQIFKHCIQLTLSQHLQSHWAKCTTPPTHTYFQLGEDFADMAVAAFCYVHVLLVALSLKDRLGCIWEVLMEREVCSHVLYAHLPARFGPDLACVFLPTWYNLQERECVFVCYITACDFTCTASLLNKQKSPK